MSAIIDKRGVKAVPLLTAIQSPNRQLYYLSTSSLVRTLLSWPHASCRHAPDIRPYFSPLHLSTSLLRDAESKKSDHLAEKYLWIQAHSHSHAEQLYPARFRGIHAVIDELCVNDPPCRSGCSVWESLGHSVELTPLWYHPTTYSHLIRNRCWCAPDDHFQWVFRPQPLKNTRSLESTSSVWQGSVTQSGVRLPTGW